MEAFEVNDDDKKRRRRESVACILIKGDAGVGLGLKVA